MKPFYILLVCLSLTITTGCNTFKFGWEREDGQETELNENNEVISGIDGPTGGHFDDEGNWIPNDPGIALTYKIPDISMGFIFDINSLDISPSINIELLEFNSHIPYVNTIVIDGGVAYQRAFLYVGKLWTNIFEISSGIWGGWNWEDNEPAYGVSFAIIKF